jgi:cell fate regulator YaaT (PSP1 superfamily)
MAKIVGVKFAHSGKIYYFDPQNETYKKGEGVIVETSRGVEYGVIITENKDVEDSEVVQPLKPISRRASKRDSDRVAENEKKIPEIIKKSVIEVEKLGLEMKIVDAEIPFDGGKTIIYFSSPKRIDFRDLVKTLATELRSRIELRQIGSRDEAKLLGGIAPCGRVCCCKAFLQEYKSATIKMAKNQGLSLNPAKISGLCGRLMCCLEYENEPYAEAYKKMPKVGSEVQTPDGKATVISCNMLKMTVKTRTSGTAGELIYKDYNLDELTFKKKAVPDQKDDEDIETQEEN